MKSTYERFWDKVVERDKVLCWDWLGTHNKGGYGLFWPTNRATWPAHRYMFSIENNNLIADMEIHHTCNNPGCVNPYHLEQVTKQYNMSQGKKAQQTHCINGHEFTYENTYIKPNGCRNCKTCTTNRKHITRINKFDI